jgi:hypothetical protein
VTTLALEWREENTAYPLMAYGKKDREDLSASQRKTLVEVVKELTDG